MNTDIRVPSVRSRSRSTVRAVDATVVDVPRRPAREPAAMVAADVDRRALRAIDGGTVSGVTLPGLSGREVARPPARAPVRTGRTGGAPAAPLGSTSRGGRASNGNAPTGGSTANRAGTGTITEVTEIVGPVGSYRAKLGELADLAAGAADVAVQLGQTALNGADELWSVTTDLWNNKGSFGKLGAVFTGLASALLYALGGLLSGLGKIVGWLASLAKTVAGNGDESVSDRPGAASQRGTDATVRDQQQKLEDLKREQALTQKHLQQARRVALKRSTSRRSA